MDFDIVPHVIATRDSDGFVYVQPEPLASPSAPADEKSSRSYEALLHAGLIVRPKDQTGGIGANLLFMRRGAKSRMIICHDPRWMSALPDFGAGGTALYATTELSGTKVAPFVGFFGSGGAAAEGTFRISVPSAAGTVTIEVNPSTGDVTITHPGGAVIKVNSLGVHIGGDLGESPIARYTELSAFCTSVVAFASAVVAAAAAGTLGAPITLPAVTPLSPSAAAQKGFVL